MKRLLSVFLLCLMLPLRAETVQSVPNPLRTKRSWVSDNANVIDGQSELQTNRAIEAFNHQTGGEIAVVTVENTNGETPKEFATALFNYWGVGQKGKDNGVLVLLVMGRRRLEIETGYGTEGDLPDGKVGEIRDQYAIPAFKSGDFGGGVLATTNAIIQELSPAPSTPKPKTAFPNSNPKPAHPAKSSQKPAHSPSSVPQRSNQPYNQPHYQPATQTSSGPYDVIIGLFILALFPIGIGVLIWGVVAIFKQLATRKCQMCGRVMRRLDEKEEDVFLSSDQQFEERLGGLDYKVWKCDGCGVCHIERSARWMSNYKECTRCHHYSMKVTSETVQQPTYHSTGLRETKRRCEYPNCGHYEHSAETLPMLVHTTVSSGSTSFGSSSSNNSSFGNSSSSSSDFSSSSSDFGGGSSGGGGAGGNW